MGVDCAGAALHTVAAAAIQRHQNYIRAATMYYFIIGYSIIFTINRLVYKMSDNSEKSLNCCHLIAFFPHY